MNDYVHNSFRLKALEKFGYSVEYRPAELITDENENNDGVSFIDHYVLMRNGAVEVNKYRVTEDLAWDDAPSIGETREMAEIAMINARYDVLVSPALMRGTYGARLVTFASGYNPVLTTYSFLTPAVAVLALFLEACEGKLVDPSKAIVLS